MEADMTEEKKQTLGQKFLSALRAVEHSKEKLLQLASVAIKGSPSHRTLEERKLPDNLTAIKMSSALAEINANLGKDLSTDGMLLMIMAAYSKHPHGQPKNFKEDFKKAFPEEFSKVKAKESTSVCMAHSSVRSNPLSL